MMKCGFCLRNLHGSTGPLCGACLTLRRERRSRMAHVDALPCNVTARACSICHTAPGNAHHYVPAELRARGYPLDGAR